MATKEEKTMATLGSIAVIGAVLYFTWWRPKKQREQLAAIQSKDSESNSEATQSFSSADCGCGA
jgi:preprotein translocase subunit YajC